MRGSVPSEGWLSVTCPERSSWRLCKLGKRSPCHSVDSADLLSKLLPTGGAKASGSQADGHVHPDVTAVGPGRLGFQR